METKRPRLEGPEDTTTAVTNKERVSGSCDQLAGESCATDQQVAAEHSEDNRAAELQNLTSLKVTIQQRSGCREFGQTDRQTDRHSHTHTHTDGQTDRQTGSLHCHVCEKTCRSLQAFKEHMCGSEHLRKLEEITQSVCRNTHTQRQERQRWCDSCQTHFSGDVIIHRRTKEHKVCKQVCRPFCPVCKRRFRTPRKFVEHMKSAEHKEQVLLSENQEDLITLDAVGCFKGEEEEEEEEKSQEDATINETVEEEEEEEVQEEEEEEEEEEGEEEIDVYEDIEKEPASLLKNTQQTDKKADYDPKTTYGTSFVVSVCGFVCQLCKKFFYDETTATHTHCRTHTHYTQVQRHNTQKKHEEEEDS